MMTYAQHAPSLRPKGKKGVELGVKYERLMYKI